MAALSLLTCGTTAVPITATQYGAVIQIAEDLVAAGTAWPTANFTVYHVAPAGGATAQGRLLLAGSSYSFQKALTFAQPYSVGEIIGYVKAATGTMVFIVDEFGS